METNEHLESGSATPSVRAREVFKKRVLFWIVSIERPKNGIELRGKSEAIMVSWKAAYAEHPADCYDKIDADDDYHCDVTIALPSAPIWGIWIESPIGSGTFGNEAVAFSEIPPELEPDPDWSEVYGAMRDRSNAFKEKLAKDSRMRSLERE